MKYLWIVLLLLPYAGCKREERKFNEKLPASEREMIRMSELQPGPVVADTHSKLDYDKNAYAQSEGKRLYNSMNCVGCHSQGGGGMGPPLMDNEWIYGSAPEQIFSTIMEGRPNGMPSFKNKLNNQQVWELVAYVRSLSGLNRKDARNGRSDHMAATDPEQARPRQLPTVQSHGSGK